MEFLEVSIPPWFDSNSSPPEFTTTTVLRFNPTVVRFKPVQAQSRYWQQAGFNPTVVRFKRVICGAENLYYLWFQSHRGSIQTDLRCFWNDEPTKFQSHRGSIQTCLFCGSREVVFHVSIPPWFDSNPFFACLPTAAAPGFNPTVVRFKLVQDPDHEHDWYQRFNPTVVRFKPARQGLLHARQESFNPTVVRFKP